MNLTFVMILWWHSLLTQLLCLPIIGTRSCQLIKVICFLLYHFLYELKRERVILQAQIQPAKDRPHRNCETCHRMAVSGLRNASVGASSLVHGNTKNGPSSYWFLSLLTRHRSRLDPFLCYKLMLMYVHLIEGVLGFWGDRKSVV